MFHTKEKQLGCDQCGKELRQTKFYSSKQELLPGKRYKSLKKNLRKRMFSQKYGDVVKQ